MKVGVVGLGFVGSGMRKLFGQSHQVVGYDPVVASSAKNDLDGAEITFICVPTPMAQDGAADISIVEEVVKWIKSPIIVIKSTVPPGTTDMLMARYRKNLHFSPEYMGEGKQFVAPWKYPDPRDARSHPFVIVGGDDAGIVLDLYSTVTTRWCASFGSTTLAWDARTRWFSRSRTASMENASRRTSAPSWRHPPKTVSTRSYCARSGISTLCVWEANDAKRKS
jgi:hypothetical protein